MSNEKTSINVCVVSWIDVFGNIRSRLFSNPRQAVDFAVEKLKSGFCHVTASGPDGADLTDIAINEFMSGKQYTIDSI